MEPIYCTVYFYPILIVPVIKDVYFTITCKLVTDLEDATCSHAGSYPGLSLGRPVLHKCWIRLNKQYIVIRLNRIVLHTQAYTRSLIQHF